MFWLDAHILRASSSPVWACTSKRPAIDRISCGSVIKRVGISISLSVRSIRRWLLGVYPPAGERGMTLAATREPMLLTPRPASAPISPWEKGLLGRPACMVGAATLVSGMIGAARAISGAMPCQALGTDSPPRCWAAAMPAEILDPQDDSWPPTPLITVPILPSMNLPTFSIRVSVLLANEEPAALLPEEPPELMNIRAGWLANRPARW